eukprot:2975145-Prymnesium_polylepis.1
MRFNLSTLRKIAITNQEWRQPPHFRAQMDAKLRRQVVAKFGERVLQLPASADEADRSFAAQLAEWQCRQLSDVGNLHVCPICLLWLRQSGGARDDGVVYADEEAEAEAEAERAEALLCEPCEPMATLFTSSAVLRWEEEHRFSWPAEAGAAQAVS